MEIIYVIKLVLLPPAIFIVLILLGWLMRRQRVGEGIFFIGWGGLLLFSLPWTADFLARQWETIPPVQDDQMLVFQPQAIVVIGGGIKKTGMEQEAAYVLTERTIMRLRYAAQLAKRYELPLLVSGGRVFAKTQVSEAELMAKWLQENESIQAKWLEQESRNTAENARYSFKRLSPIGIHRIVLVTQAYHMPRALRQFALAGFQVLPAPMGFIRSQEKWDIFSFIPTARALEKNFLLLHEQLGLLWYRLRYG
jgi:uncharacterized SAM-binding protein YcdF (DUF218 family)